MENRIKTKFNLKNLIEINPKILKPKKQIRELCFENKCDNFKQNYMCPPAIGSIDELTKKISFFNKGFLFQFEEFFDAKNLGKLIESKLKFHDKVLSIEKTIKTEIKPKTVWGFIAGNCELCKPCKIVLNKPCPHKEKARTSLEAIGIDVLLLLKNFSIDNNFYKDKVIWTGAVLYQDLCT